MPKMTKRLVDAAEARDAECFTWDSEIPGFGLRVLPSGRKGLPMIGKLLGHTQVQTTARYAHLAVEPLQMAADAVAQNLRQSLG